MAITLGGLTGLRCNEVWHSFQRTVKVYLDRLLQRGSHQLEMVQVRTDCLGIVVSRCMIMIEEEQADWRGANMQANNSGFVRVCDMADFG